MREQVFNSPPLIHAGSHDNYDNNLIYDYHIVIIMENECAENAIVPEVDELQQFVNSLNDLAVGWFDIWSRFGTATITISDRWIDVAIQSENGFITKTVIEQLTAGLEDSNCRIIGMYGIENGICLTGFVRQTVN